MKYEFEKKLGFGFLRLPHIDPNDPTDVDVEACKEMIDLFMERGFRYFDTAYIYLNGKSESYLRQVLVERYPRESFMIATKLPCYLLNEENRQEDIFEKQLENCGVDYFDVYLLHGLDAEDAQIAEEHDSFGFLRRLKAEGRVKKIGLSFHDTADVLDDILTRHPELDIVQIQLNYLDWDHEIIQSGACYEVCRKHGKTVVVMEPVKGGTLANIPEEARVFLNGEAPARRALRFAASQESVDLVLSGMSTLEQVDENTSLMLDFVPLSQEETEVLEEVRRIVKASVAIPCTGCSYCTEGCPAGIPIPRYFKLYNERIRDGWQVYAEARYTDAAKHFAPANACIGCGQCEEKCPQKLTVMEYMQKVSELFDKAE